MIREFSSEPVVKKEQPGTRFLGRAPENNMCEIKPVHDTDAEPVGISSGHYGITTEKEFIIDGKAVSLVEKKSRDRNRYEPETIERQLLVHQELRKANVPTFDDFVTDGKNLYSTPLNRNGVVALSWNSPVPQKRNGKDYERIFDEGLVISNFRDLCEKMVLATEAAVERGIDMAVTDAIFFLVPEDHDGAPVHVDFMVGDFDLVHINKNHDKKQLLEQCMENVEMTIRLFVGRFVRKDKRAEYNEISKEAFGIK